MQHVRPLFPPPKAAFQQHFILISASYEMCDIFALSIKAFATSDENISVGITEFGLLNAFKLDLAIDALGTAVFFDYGARLRHQPLHLQSFRRISAHECVSVSVLVATHFWCRCALQ